MSSLPEAVQGATKLLVLKARTPVGCEDAYCCKHTSRRELRHLKSSERLLLRNITGLESVLGTYLNSEAEQVEVHLKKSVDEDSTVADDQLKIHEFVRMHNKPRKLGVRSPESEVDPDPITNLEIDGD